MEGLGLTNEILVTFSLGIAIGIGLGIIGFILGKILSPAKEYPRKRERYECANPPRGRARGLFMMQYYPFLILFLTLEPIMIYSFLFLMEAHRYILNTTLLFGAMVAILASPLVFGIYYVRRLELWSAH
ncbi:MAG: NADH-quinone oxidoreductase subunit A [Candidatus Korarchaeota archaeon]|nr:NADH-quinone oxidoreductase subunit A [Candidatus Korarchaeota archaeon]